MGGRALNHLGFVPDRISRNEFILLKKEILPLINFYFGEADIPYQIKNKESFGDMDIIIKMNEFNRSKDFVKTIKILFNPSFIKKCGDTISFDYKNHQIDLLFFEDIHKFSFYYFCYGDLFNLLGKIIRQNNIKLSFRGLELLIPNKDQNQNNQNIQNIQNKKYSILLSQDPKMIIEFFGLSYETFLNGFETNTNLFEYITSSKFFKPTIFGFDKNITQKKINSFLKRKGLIQFNTFILQNFNFSCFDNKFLSPESETEFEFETKSINFDLNQSLEYFKKEKEYNLVLKKIDKQNNELIICENRKLNDLKSLENVEKTEKTEKTKEANTSIKDNNNVNNNITNIVKPKKSKKDFFKDKFVRKSVRKHKGEKKFIYDQNDKIKASMRGKPRTLETIKRYNEELEFTKNNIDFN